MPSKGQRHRPEVIERIRSAHAGRKLSNHHRAQISRGMQRWWAERFAEEQAQTTLPVGRAPRKGRR